MSKKKKITPKEEGYVFPTEGGRIEDIHTEELAGKSVSFDAHEITSKIIEFGKILTGLSLYKYQEEAVYAIIYSIITFSGDVKTMLFSRQSGKSEAMAFVIDTLTVLLPALAKVIPDLEQFSSGFRIGLFAPQSDQVVTTYSRAMTRINSANAEMVLSDPDIDVYLESSARLELSNGSYLAGQVASKQSKIESKTYDLVIVEEAQDVDDLIVQKCYAEDTLINLPYGDYATIKDVVERKLPVLTPEGKMKPSAWHNTGVQGVYKITLCNGRELEVTSQHRHLVRRRNVKESFELHTDKLKVGDRLAVPDFIPTFGHYGDYSMGVVIGFLLGDRCFSGSQVQFCGFEEVWNFVSPHVEKLGCVAFTNCFNKNGLYEGTFRNVDGKNTPNKIIGLLKDLGLWGLKGENKFIPNLPYSKEFLVGLICGLFESDGSVQALKKGNIRYASISKKLVYGLSLQLQKFGIHCSISVKSNIGKGVYENTKPLYELHIRDNISVIRFCENFRLVTKNEKLDKAKLIAERINKKAGATKVYDGNRYVRIKSIEYTGEKQTYCVTVPTEGHWIIANGIVSGNSIEPMLSATGGTLIKVGTTGMVKNHFWYEIQHNKNIDRKIVDPRIKNHFEYDYKRIIHDRRLQYDIDHKRFHLNYEADIQRKKERWGEDSQAFKLAYALIWDLESGMLLSDKEYNGIINRKLGLQDARNEDYVVAGLDIGKHPAETVLTIVKVFHGEDVFDRPYKQILAWACLGGLDYESQHHVIMDFIVEFNISVIFADYTGVGKPVVDRLMYACGEYVTIEPYTFTAQSKSDMWFNFLSDIQTHHLIVPANKKTRMTPEYMKFEEQMKNCQKYYNGTYLVCEKSEGYFDDMVDSCALACMAATYEQEVKEEMEVTPNPLYEGVTSTIQAIRRHSF
jgi:intein/homing endonuclease